MATNRETPIIRADELSIVRDDTEIIPPQTFNIPQGLTVIAGESGAGKSTLALALHGLIPPATGQVTHLVGEYAPVVFEPEEETFCSRALRKVLPDRYGVNSALTRHRAQNLGFIAQSPHILRGMSASEYISLTHAERGNVVDSQWVEHLTEALGITEHIDKTSEQLSGGERQRVAIVAALAHEPTLVTADEPTAALDSHATELTYELFSSMRKNGTHVIMVSHDPVAREIADTVVFMKDGKIISRDHPVN